jgi:uncharacterized membrane protein YcjF (UPF0283 family)
MPHIEEESNLIEQLSAFVQEQWWVILIAIFIFLIIVKVVKSIIKWILIIVLVVAVLTYGANYQDLWTNVSNQVVTEAKDKAFDAIMNQTLKAQYQANEDGTYAVFTDSVRVEGQTGSNNVTLYWNEIKVGTFPIDEAIRTFIEQGKQNR